LAGIKQVTGDLEKGTLVVEYDPQAVTPDQIAQQIEKVGFRVQGRFNPCNQKGAHCSQLSRQP
jgi:copper chaperone CopZ